MTYSRDQLANFRAAFASLSVVGPEWRLPAWPTIPTMRPCVRGQRGSKTTLTVNGRTQTILAWSVETGLHVACIRARLFQGKSAEDAVKITGTRPGQPMRIK